ncbi:MAG: hypothetical protein A2Z14_05325 [Chloroflexi bacterium RBG_16_48_8]|nr:MAG: hypothetical protein A2Z14_05325 [Chloroflexi bacterium RBG_16_48_8]
MFNMRILGIGTWRKGVDLSRMCPYLALAGWDLRFFFKQWGGVRKKNNGRILQGRTWDQIPSYSEAYA